MDFHSKVYGGDSQYCVMFLSEQYKKKPYPYRERLAAINKFYENMGTTYILPVRFDDTNIEELPNSIAYIDIRKKDLVQIGELLLIKLGCRNAIIPDYIDMDYVSLGTTIDLRRHLSSLSPKNIVRCPKCNAPFDVTTIPEVEGILCPNCSTNFNPKQQVQSIIKERLRERKIENRAIGTVATIKLDSGRCLDKVTCCYCRKSFESSVSDFDEKREGVYILIYNRTVPKQTFLFFCKKCRNLDIEADVDLDKMNMFPSFGLR